MLQTTVLGGWGLCGLGQSKKLELGAGPVPYLDTHYTTPKQRKRSL